MSTKRNNIRDIKWSIDNENKPLNLQDLELLEIPFKLPQAFIELLKIKDGGDVDYRFKYYDIGWKEVACGGILTIFGVCPIERHYDLISNYIDPPEFFPKGLVAFGDRGNSDRICFDYRQDPTTDNPPIVYWSSEQNEGEDVSFVANNFEAFIQMLEEPED